MTDIKLVGFIRKGEGNVLKLSIDTSSLEKAHKHETQDGRSYIRLTINADKMQQILNGDREVTSICERVEQ